MIRRANRHSANSVRDRRAASRTVKVAIVERAPPTTTGWDSSVAQRRRRSSSVPTPPEAITSHETARAEPLRWPQCWRPPPKPVAPPQSV